MFLLLSAWAHAAPLVLPAQEDSALWSAPMELHGFERATTTTGARARLVEGEGQWTLIVVDSSGRTHRAQVPAPVTPADREDTLALAARLLAPTTALALPELLPAEPAPKTQRRTLPELSPAPPDIRTLQIQLRPKVSFPQTLPQSPAGVAQRPTLSPPTQRLASARLGTSFVKRPDMELSAGLSADLSWGSPQPSGGPGRALGRAQFPALGRWSARRGCVADGGHLVPAQGGPKRRTTRGVQQKKLVF